MAYPNLNEVRVYWGGSVSKTNHMDSLTEMAGQFTEKLHVLFGSTIIGITRFIRRAGTDSIVCSGPGFIIVLFSANGTEAFFSHNGRRVSYHAAISAQIKSHIAH